MRSPMYLAILALMLAFARPAAAWDPDGDVPSDATPPEWTPEPAPAGLYLVTETYAGDSVVQAGAVTTYSTETVHEITGTYARVLEAVGTGGSSAYDGAAFNGRASMTDGRAVAGTYYENYIWTERGFVPVSIVFFQDDSEIARAAAAARPGSQAPTIDAPATPVTPPPAFGSPTTLAPAPGAPAIGVVSPIVVDEDTTPATRAPSGRSADRSIEVLRGRRTSLAFSGLGVRTWRFVAGECVPLGALSGTDGDPFVARWDRLAPAGTAWQLRFVLDRVDGTSQELIVRVTVRAPGLVE